MRKNLIISLVSILLLLGALEGIAWIFVGAPKTEKHQLSHEYGWEWTPEYQFGKVKISDETFVKSLELWGSGADRADGLAAGAVTQGSGSDQVGKAG